MKSKAARVTLIALFLALIYVPGLVWLAAGGKLKKPNLENRELAQWPQFSFAEIESLPGKIEKYYRDHLPFREQLIGAYARLDKAVFDDSVVTTVVFGKEGWYYLNNVNDGDSIASYRGEDLYTAEELREIVVNLRHTRDNLAKQGIDFILFIAPNKERVYPEYMPDRYGRPAESYGTRQLVEFLQAHSDLKVVYMYDELMQAKAEFSDYPLYYTRDTHWNDIGAYIGARRLLQLMGVDVPALSRDRIVITGSGYKGDLSIMAHLNDYITGETQYMVADEKRPELSITHIDNGVINIAKGSPKGKRLFVKNDSFLTGMMAYVFPYFSETEAYFNHVYDDALVDGFQPDIFVQVLVERNVRKYLTQGPLYTPPENR